MGLTLYPNGTFSTPNLPGSQGIPPTTGTIYFVDSNGGTRTDGKSPDTALATIDAAYNKCTADKGDQIWVMPNHAETISLATSLVMDTAGIAIYGLGNGAEIPVLTFSVAAAVSTIDITATGNVLSGLKFLAGVSAIDRAIDVSADDTLIENCEFNWGTTSGYDFEIMIDVDAVDRCVIRNNKFIAEEIAGCNEAIRIDDAQQTQIVGNWFDGDFTNGAIYSASGDTASTSILIADNDGYNSDTTLGAGVRLACACTGIIKNNHFATAYTSAANDTLDPGSCGCSGNRVSKVPDGASEEVPWGLQGGWRLLFQKVNYAGGNASATLAIGTVGTHSLFDIGGTIEALVCGTIGTTLTGASATVSVGVTGDADALLGISTGTDLDNDEVWIATAGLASAAPWTDFVHRPVVIAGAASPSIFGTVATADITTGTVNYTLFWRPLTADAYANVATIVSTGA